MQNALGVSQQECQNLHYEGNNLVLEIQTPREKLCCPVCGSHNFSNQSSERLALAYSKVSVDRFKDKR